MNFVRIGLDYYWEKKEDRIDCIVLLYSDLVGNSKLGTRRCIMVEEIKKLLTESSALPVLFVGSGLTRRYLNLPAWEGLLRQYCVKPGFSFEYYYDKARRNCYNNPDMIFPIIADYIENDFNELWYTDDQFKETREKHQDEIKQKISPLKICMSDFFRDSSETLSREYSDEIKLFMQIGQKNISCVITTNYDLFLENCFGNNNFKTYIGQNELLFSTIYEVAEIYKIHGCCSKAESIVIDSNDYRQLEAKSVYLSSKILAMFLERPIIFLGYGVRDPDIRRILDSVASCLENDQLSKLKQRLIFVEHNSKHEREDGISERQFDSSNGKTITMMNLLLTDYSPLYQAILENKVRYDVKALRRIKSQLYELVKDNKPTEKLYVATDIEDKNAEIDFVVGVGVYASFGKVGYRGIKAEELYLFSIGKSTLKYDETMLLKEAIPSLYNGRSTLPVCQLICNCKGNDCFNEKVRHSLKRQFNDILSWGEKEKLRKEGYKTIATTIVEHYNKVGLTKTLSKIPLLNPTNVDVDDLYAFLIKALDDEPKLLSGKGHQSRSQYKKCISIWDWLKFSANAQKRITEIDKQK